MTWERYEALREELAEERNTRNYAGVKTPQEAPQGTPSFFQRYTLRVDLEAAKWPEDWPSDWQPKSLSDWSPADQAALQEGRSPAGERLIEGEVNRRADQGLVAWSPDIQSKICAELNRVSAWVKLTNFPEILEALEAVDPFAAEAMRQCADPECGYVAFCPDGHHAQFRPKRCNLRICPNCAKKIGAELRAKLEKILDQVLSGRPFTVRRLRGGKMVDVVIPGAHWKLKHLVPTFRRSEDERRDIEDVHDISAAIFKALWGEDQRAGAYANLEFGPKGGNVHPHILLWGPFVDVRKISDELRRQSLKIRPMYAAWVSEQRAILTARVASLKASLKACTDKRSQRARRLRAVILGLTKRGGIDAAIFRRAKRQGQGDFICHISAIDKDKALGEVVKYVTKLHKRDAKTGEFETSPADLAALHIALKGKRRSWSWGSFYGVDLPEDKKGGEDHDPQACPQCNKRLVLITVAEARGFTLLEREDKLTQTSGICPVGRHTLSPPCPN